MIENTTPVENNPTNTMEGDGNSTMTNNGTPTTKKKWINKKKNVVPKQDGNSM